MAEQGLALGRMQQQQQEPLLSPISSTAWGSPHWGSHTCSSVASLGLRHARKHQFVLPVGVGMSWVCHEQPEQQQGSGSWGPDPAPGSLGTVSIQSSPCPLPGKGSWLEPRREPSSVERRGGWCLRAFLLPLWDLCLPSPWRSAPAFPHSHLGLELSCCV